MERRQLLRCAAALPFLGQVATDGHAAAPTAMPLIKPQRLAPGDTIAVIAPSSGLKPEAFEVALKRIEGLGFKPRIGKYARGQNDIFSGTDAERLHDLHWAFADPETRGIWCIRGGDGAPRLLPDVDFDVIRRNPKVFVGFSDITALHVAILQRCGLVTFHGPVGTSSFSDYTREHALNVLTKPTAPYRIEPSPANQANTSDLFKSVVIMPGRARGRLIGGNLSLLTAMAGTPWALENTRGKLLFLEDIDEQPYRVDRMLTQLRQSLDLRELAGIALGVFADCVPTEKKPSRPVIDFIRDRLGDLGIPVMYGLSFGHIREQFTLPLGIEAELDTATGTLTLLETAVQ